MDLQGLHDAVNRVPAHIDNGSAPAHHVAGPKWTHDERPDLVARARRLVEESGLGRVEIAAQLGVGVATVTNWRRRFGWVWAEHRRGGRRPAVAGVAWPKLHRRAGPGREHPPAVVAEARRLFEEGELTRAAIAARLGVGIVAIRRWAVRDGWRYPARWEVASRLIPVREGVAVIAAPGPRARRGRGRPYRRETMERAQALVEGSGLSQTAIAAQLGIGQSTVARWIEQRDWRRPLDAYRFAPAVPADRAGLSVRLAAGFARVAALAEEGVRGAPSLTHAEERPEVASRSTLDGGASFETPAPRAPRDDAGGSVRSGSGAVEGVPSSSRDGSAALVRLARAARRLSRRYDRAGLVRLPVPRRSFGGDPWEPIRLSAVPKGPRHHPRGEDVLAQARIAWERTRATRETIAREIGVRPATLTRWAQGGGWIRPDGAHSPFAGRPRNLGLRARMAQRAEADRRLAEAERRLEAPAGIADLEAAFALLRGAARVVGEPVPKPPPAAAGGERA